MSAIPYPVEIVVCFRRPESLKTLVPELLKKEVKVLWLQLGVINKQVKDEAESNGIQVIMDRCVKIEHARLFGGLNFMGVNTKVITSKEAELFSIEKIEANREFGFETKCLHSGQIPDAATGSKRFLFIRQVLMSLTIRSCS